ncbi:MAG: hypothetical protein JO212_09485 [Acetobacteraceae bacterium]|nr:hypothetical protein [Acetobacteraceae bacterium]
MTLTFETPAPEQPDEALAQAYRDARAEWAEELRENPEDGLTNSGEKFVAGMAVGSAQQALRRAFPEGMAITLAHVIAQAARLSV